MSWDEAKYIINKVKRAQLENQATGIPPRNMTVFTVKPRHQMCEIKVGLPADTIIDGQLICTVKGVRVMRKIGSAPIGPEDGTLVIDVQKDTVYEDEGLVNGVTYYYAAFPYSDHGVYNFNKSNVKGATPSSIHYWAFNQNFSDKNPATTITYPTGFQNESFQAMLTNEGTGSPTAGDWEDFLINTLRNYPAMVSKEGTMNAALNPDDYTKYIDGSASDYNNLSYNGGAFAWLEKIYMLEEYSSDGESREVQFADGPAEGFTPVGFYDFDQNELDGIWLPMGYMDASGRVLIAGTTPVASKTTAQEKALIDAFSSRAVFLGGPILNLLRDLEYMLFKSTDIQLRAGHGRCNAGSQAVTANIVVANGAVRGWKGTNDKKTMNKYFHSQLLGSYQQYIRDPYTVLVSGRLKVSPYYIFDPTGATYVDTGINWSTTSAWKYPSHTQKISNLYGSFPKDENTATSATGLCDGVYGNASGTRVAIRLGITNNDLIGGPADVSLYNEATAASWNVGVGLLLLPPTGYEPEFTTA